MTTGSLEIVEHCVAEVRDEVEGKGLLLNLTAIWTSLVRAELFEVLLRVFVIETTGTLI